MRAAEFDILVGINLLREGLDLPEVSLVCILDADKEGYLRSQTSLIQTAGRAARHVNGEVYLFADIVTKQHGGAASRSPSTGARKQIAYNEKHGITPPSVQRAVQESLHTILRAPARSRNRSCAKAAAISPSPKRCANWRQEMMTASANLEYERAALLRDQIAELKSRHRASRRSSRGGSR